MSSGHVAAIDLGATSGRVILARVDSGGAGGGGGAAQLSMRTVARFPNTPVRTPDGLHWNALGLYRSVLEGLTTAVREAPELASIGVDSWAVDYGLLRAGRLLGGPLHYRDDRTADAIDDVHARIDAAALYARNGLQFLPFNTLYQLRADAASGQLACADSLLLIPDLITFWLTGEQRAERTNASTTGLLGVASGEWDHELVSRLDLPIDLLPSLVDAGDRVGSLLAHVAREIGVQISAGTPGSSTHRPIDVVAVGSHDTASAVVAVPMQVEAAAYISCGTWGLVGVELENPVLTEASHAANFTNERGVDGRIRFLHNVMGLWLLNESVREWERSGGTIVLADLLEDAAAVRHPVAVFDANDPAFLAPGDMPARIAEHCVERGLPVPYTRAEIARSIVESLAEAFAQAVRTAAELSSREVRTIHIVGGGALNSLLCQLTADRAGLLVLAGPVEATAIGNVLVQARAQGFVSGGLEELRMLVARTFSPRRFEPRLNTAQY